LKICCSGWFDLPELLLQARALSLAAMGAAFGIDAAIGEAQAFDGLSADQVLLHDLSRIRRLHMAVPNRLRVNHNGGPMLALVETAGFIDAHRRAQPCGLGQLLQLRVQFAFSIGGARGARRIGRTGVQTHKNMAFK
jgi:hypothetical protein